MDQFFLLGVPERGFSLLDLLLIGAFQLFHEHAISDRFTPVFRAVSSLVKRGVRLTNSFHFSTSLARDPPDENARSTEKRNSATAIENAHKNVLQWIYYSMQSKLHFRHFSHSDFIDCFQQLLRAGIPFYFHPFTHFWFRQKWIKLISYLI